MNEKRSKNNQTEEVCVDLFADTIYPWMKSYPLRRVNGKRIYYTVTLPYDKKGKLIHLAKRNGIRFRYYAKRWGRSATYRESFLRHNQPPYRCGYCGRKLTEETLFVDHIVPVFKTKTSRRARTMLTRRKIYDVNDTRNLIAACEPCNRKKGNRLGMWYFRGRMGKHSWFPLVYRTVKILLVTLLMLLAVFVILQSNLIGQLSAIL